MSSRKCITVGLILIFCQLGSMLGQFQGGLSLRANLTGGVNDLIYLAGFFCIGLVGVVFLAVGLVKRKNGK